MIAVGNSMLDFSRVSAKRINSKDENVYRFRVTCRKCLTDNFFDYNSDNEN